MHLLVYNESSERPSGSHGWRWLVLMLFVIAVAAIVARSVYFVDESEYVYVTQFGRPVRFHREPGLNVKWPYQSLRRFDRRLQMFEPPAREMLTQDKENLNFAWFVCWRLPGQAFAESQVGSADRLAEERLIEEHVHRFLMSAGSVEILENRLEERVQAALAAEVGRLRFDQLVSLDASQVQLEALAGRVTQSIRDAAAAQFGVEVVDVRLKRVIYPEAVKPAVFAEIRSERERVAVQYRAEGASEKAKIQSTADRQREQLLAHARRESLSIRGQGEAKAMEIFNAAHSKDPEFYELLKTLETYRAVLDSQTTVVLSADSPLLKLLNEGVREPSQRTAPPASPTLPPTLPPVAAPTATTSAATPSTVEPPATTEVSAAPASNPETNR